MATLRLVSTGANGQANASSNNPSISANGRYVAFETTAGNLATGDTNGGLDVFVKDMATGTVVRASGVGNFPFGTGTKASISEDGKSVAFLSTAAYLATDQDTTTDVYLKNLETGQFALMSQNQTSSTAINQSVSGLTKSSTGNYFSFQTQEQLTVDAPSASSGTMKTYSYSNGVLKYQSFGSSIRSTDVFYSDTGVIAFSSPDKVIATDTNFIQDVYVKSGSTYTRITETVNGAANSTSTTKGLSADGRYVLFTSEASNLAVNDTNGTTDVFVKDLRDGTLTCVTSNAAGNPLGGSDATMSADGRYVAFSSSSAGYVAGDTNGRGDVFVKDLQTGTIARISVGASGVGGGGQPVISGDGKSVTFVSDATDLVAGDANGARDIFWADLSIPVAWNYAFTTSESAALSNRNVFADNGSGPDTALGGASLSIAKVNGQSVSVGKAITLASGAIVTLKANGALSYNPNHAFDSLPGASSGASNTSARDSFTYTLAGGGTATVTVTVTGLDTNDLLRGTSGADRLSGGSGDDTIIADAEDDILNGGSGVDTADYSRSTAGLTINLALNRAQALGAFGSDTFVSIENLKTGSGNDRVTGTSAANRFTTGDGNDTLDGGGGADILSGGKGNDVYRIDNVSDQVIESSGGGTDTVFTTVSYTLASHREIEVLRTADIASTRALKLTGNEFAQKLVGNAGANTLDGKGGADTMQGLAGNDTYIVDNAHDIVLESAGSANGSDTIMSSVSLTLAANVEQLVLTGSSSLSATGNALANTITGNAGNNLIDGGLGNDRLKGGGGNDTFLFKTTLGSGNVDHVLDFSAGHDRIQLENAIFKGLAAGTLDAHAFKDITHSSALDADDRILYNQSTGALYYDADGSGSQAKVVFAILDTHPALDYHSILVV